MSKCFIEGMGGGAAGKLFAVIQVKYPEGSSCTATNGTKTLTAPDKSGTVIFAIPEPKVLPETWVVTSTDPADPTKTSSQAVAITSEGQVENVALNYTIVLFDNGVVNEDYGGFIIYSSNASGGTSTLTYSDNLMVCYAKYKTGSSSYNALYVTAEPVDLTGKEYVEYTIESAQKGESGYPRVFVDEDYTTVGQNVGTPVAYAAVAASTSKQTVVLDLNGLTGLHHVGLQYLVPYNGAPTTKISKIEVH